MTMTTLAGGDGLWFPRMLHAPMSINAPAYSTCGGAARWAEQSKSGAAAGITAQSGGDLVQALLRFLA